MFHQATNTMNIHILGPIGTYGHEAASTLFTETSNCVFVFHPLNQTVLQALEKDPDENSLAIIPIENSTRGLVEEVIGYWRNVIDSTHKQIIRGNIHVCGEYGLAIQHCLVVKPNHIEQKIKRIFSHAQALGQCAEKIHALAQHQELEIESIAVSSTAAALSAITVAGDAAICSEFCAMKNGGLVLDSRFNDFSTNKTRFHILSNKQSKNHDTENKTAILYYLRNEPRSATNASWSISAGNVNITTEHSIPTGDPGVYAFYKEFEASVHTIEGHRILKRLSTFAEKILILGSYPSDPSVKGGK